MKKIDPIWWGVALAALALLAAWIWIAVS